MWKPLPSRHVLKTLRGSPKRTISASNGLGLLQMISEPDTGRCASKDAGPRRGLNWEVPHQLEKGISARTLGPKGGWIVRSPSGGKENETFFIRVWKPLPRRRVFKTLRGSSKGKLQRRQYLLAVGLGR